MAANASLIEPLLVRLFHTHMRIVAVDACEIDIGVVFIEVAFVGSLETGAHLESFGVPGHHESGIALVGGHIYGKHGI